MGAHITKPRKVQPSPRLGLKHRNALANNARANTPNLSLASLRAIQLPPDRQADLYSSWATALAALEVEEPSPTVEHCIVRSDYSSSIL